MPPAPPVPVNTPFILAAGESADGTAFAVIRYLESDGSRDVSWGTGGLVTTAFGPNSSDSAFSLAVQSDGKVIAVGQSFDNDTNTAYFAVARYNTDGSLDTGFGTGGKFTTNFVATDTTALATSVAIQGDGKIVVVGYASNDALTQAMFALIRLNADGTLDTTGFGTGGKVRTTFPGSASDQARAVALQGDGKIIVAGVTNNTLTAVARYTTAGVLDGTWGTAGLATGNGSSATSVVIQADGKIVAAGYKTVLGVKSFYLARFTTGGILDAAGFGTGGETSFAFGTSGETNTVALGVAVQPADQKIVVSGYANGDAELTAAARLETDGALDTLTFGTLGKVTSSFGDNTQTTGSTLLQTDDGKVVTTAGQAAGGGFALARYSTVGVLDGTWGAAGLVSDVGGLVAFALAQQTIASPPPSGVGDCYYYRHLAGGGSF